MPSYEFRCRACGETFAVDRPMSRSAEPAACPEGHTDTTRLMTIGAVTRGSSAGRVAAEPPCGMPASQAGGCCGGGGGGCGL